MKKQTGGPSGMVTDPQWSLSWLKISVSHQEMAIDDVKDDSEELGSLPPPLQSSFISAYKIVRTKSQQYLKNTRATTRKPAWESEDS